MEPSIYPLEMVVSSYSNQSEQTEQQKTSGKTTTPVASSISRFYEEAISSIREFFQKKTKPLSASQEPSSAEKVYINYTKGEVATCSIVPTKKGVERLGKGTFGKVYVHGLHEDQVIKKVATHPIWAPTIEDLSVMVSREFEIGTTLDHPNIIKYKQFITKHYPDQQIKIKLVMGRIRGKTLEEYRKSKAEMRHGDFLKILKQAKDASVHVFNHGIAWGDVSDKNVYITEDNQLMLSDYGYWSFHPNATDRAKKLLLGSMEMVEWLMKLSPFNSLDQETLQKIIYPQSFFRTQMCMSATESFEPDTYDRCLWMKNVINSMQSYNDSQRIKVVELYWDHVISQFNLLAMV